MRYALFLGCSVPVRTLGYELAARRVAKELGVELVDVPGFRCCGYPLKALDQRTGLLVAAYNLSLAEAQGLPITTLCNACSGTLTEADLELKTDAALREQVNRDLAPQGLSFQGQSSVRHYLRLLDQEIGWDAIAARVKQPLAGLKVAVHYGCHYFRPSHVYQSYGPSQAEAAEAPAALDRLVATCGAQSIIYPGRADCCGGGLVAVDQNLALAQARKKVASAREFRADALLVACPTCGLVFGNCQEERDLPVVFFPQLLGLALGIDPEELGLSMNQIPADTLLERLGV